jgi:hypothetical protein
VALAELTHASRRLALVGLAKNTGKTVALTALLRELQERGERVGVTSVGRDGEERDVIDVRIAKPRVLLCAGSIVATTDSLLSVSGIPHEILQDTHVRTPLGRVLIARLREAGTVEVAGPSAAADVARVGEAMLGHGAERVLIDGAIDRRAASSPQVSEGLVLCTGAVLGSEPEEVIERTRDAVELVRLAPVADARVRELARSVLERSPARGARASGGVLVDASYGTSELDGSEVLRGEPARIEALLASRGAGVRWLILRGALPEPFLQGLVRAARAGRRELCVVVADSTHVFLGERAPGWYRRQGVAIGVLEPISLHAVTVNPVAPQSHSFDSAQLRERLAHALGDVPVFDVLAADYGAAAAQAAEALP